MSRDFPGGPSGLTPTAANKKRRGNNSAFSSGNPARLHKQISGNLPRFADLVDHLDRQRTAAIEQFGCARSGAQQFGKLGLRMSQLLDRVIQKVDRIRSVD